MSTKSSHGSVMAITAVVTAIVASATLSFNIASSIHNHAMYKTDKLASINCLTKMGPKNKHSEIRCRNEGNGSAYIESAKLYFKGQNIDNTTQSIKNILPQGVDFEINPIQTGIIIQPGEEVVLIRNKGSNSMVASGAILKFLTQATLEFRYLSPARECSEKMLGTPQEKSLSCSKGYFKYFDIATTLRRN